MALDGYDIAVVAIYFVTIIAVAVLSSLRNRGNTKGYFLAGRDMHWLLVGASLFASNIGSGHFIGLAGSGAAMGLGMAVFEVNTSLFMPILGWLFVPIYMASGVYTMPQYLAKRFGGIRIRMYLSVLALLLYIFTKISADLYAGALFMEQAVPAVSMFTAVVVLLVMAGAFTIMGGLTAVIWTDFIQTVIMIVGAIWLMIASFVEVGGLSGLYSKYHVAIANTTAVHLTTLYGQRSVAVNESVCGLPNALAFHLARPINDPDLPVLGITFGWVTMYWCADQVIVQRALAAKDVRHAKLGCVFCGYLKLLPMWVIVLPGMIARVLYADDVACVEPSVCERVCGNRKGCADIAYAKLVLHLMPSGAKGLMAAVMLSSLVTSLTSIFNSASTVFTFDIWVKVRRRSSEKEHVIVGRLFVLLMVLISVAWIPVVQQRSSVLWNYMTAIICYLAPPISAVYVLAVSSSRVTEPGAFWALFVGLVVGLSRFVWEYCYPSYGCAESVLDAKPSIVKDVHYLHFALLLFLLCFCVCIAVSYWTKPVQDVHLHRLLYSNRFSTLERVEFDYKPCENAPPSKVSALQSQVNTAISNAQVTAESTTDLLARVHEDKRSRLVTNVNMIVMLALSFFLWIFFS